MSSMQEHSAYAEAAYLNKKYDPWVKARKPGIEVGIFLIADTCHPNCWYAPFLGMEVMCQIKWDFYEGRRYISSLEAIRLGGNNRYNHGRSFHPNDLILI